MDVTVVAFFVLLALAGLLRLVELSISRRHQRVLAARGAVRIAEPHFRWMVVFHAGILVSAALEVALLHRPLIPALALPMLALFLLANALRWWVIRSMGAHWNVQVMNSVALGVIAAGPYRWVRHPNYVAVFVELLALPLIHTAWITSLLGAIINVLLLRRRVAVEEAALLADPGYRAVMGPKPRFVPRPFGAAR